MIELENHIENLLFRNDCVIVPHLGGFVTHYVPAVFDEKEGVFLPPYRSIGFNPQITMNDGLLVQSYMEVHDTSYPETIRLIDNDVRELKKQLQLNGKVEISGVGELLLKLNGVYEFIPTKIGIPSPHLYGLDSLPLNLLEAERNEIPVNQKLVKATPIEPKRQYTIIINRRWANICIAAIAALAFYFIYPSNIDSSSNTKQASMLGNIVFGSTSDGSPKQTEKILNRIKKTDIEEHSSAVKPHLGIDVNKEMDYSIVLASSVAKRNAEEFVSKLKSQGLKDAYVHVSSSMRRVLYAHYKSEDEAQSALSSFRHHAMFKDAWIMKVN